MVVVSAWPGVRNETVSKTTSFVVLGAAVFSEIIRPNW